MKKLRLFSLVALILLVTVACSGNEGGSSSEKKMLTIGKESDIISMDPHQATDTLSFEVINATIEGLFGYDEDGNLVNALAEDYEVSEDGLVYTFHLREDAVWDNGLPVTADDFVYSWRRLANPDTASQNAYLMDVVSIKNAAAVNAGELSLEELGVRAIDSKTFEVTLELPVSFFLQLTTFPIFVPLNEEFVESKGAEFATSPENSLANGPYKMTAWNQGHSFIIEKNETYYDHEVVQLDGIEYRTFPDTQTTVLEFESGNVDIVRLSGEMVDLYQDREEFTIIGSSGIYYIGPNHQMPELQNVNLRQAIGRAVNEEQLVSTVLNDGSKVSDYIVAADFTKGPDHKDFRETSDAYLSYDVELAQQYWEKAKEELGVNSLTLELLISDTDSMKKCAEYIQSELQTNLPGLKIDIKAQPSKQRLQLMRDGEFELVLSGWVPVYADPTAYLNLYTSDSAHNKEKYASDVYDALMDRVNKGDLVGDVEGRWEALKEAEKQFIEVDAGILPLFQSANIYLINPKVTGIEAHTVGVPFTYKYASLK